MVAGGIGLWTVQVVPDVDLACLTGQLVLDDDGNRPDQSTSHLRLESRWARLTTPAPASSGAWPMLGLGLLIRGLAMGGELVTLRSWQATGAWPSCQASEAVPIAVSVDPDHVVCMTQAAAGSVLPIWFAPYLRIAERH